MDDVATSAQTGGGTAMAGDVVNKKVVTEVVTVAGALQKANIGAPNGGGGGGFGPGASDCPSCATATRSSRMAAVPAVASGKCSWAI